MATNGISADFRIPQEPLPVPSVPYNERPVPLVGSDEESFVVLGKSLVPDFDDLSLEDNLGKSIIQEAKQLLKDEIDRIENKPVEQEPTQEIVNGDPETREANGIENGYGSSTNQTFHSSSSGMDHSSVLPAMPQPQLYPRIELDGNDASRTISIVSFAPSDFASEELQSKVTQLIEENIHLKDTILQNNMSMKAQYEKIVAWQRDVEKVHEAHKEKFRNAKRCIETLKKDNVRLEQETKLLQQEIDNLRYSLKLQEAEHDKTKQVLTQSSENNLKEFELEAANKRIKTLEETLEKLKKQSDDESSDASHKWNAMEEKLQRYEKELEAAYKKNRELERGSSTNDTLSHVTNIKLNEERLLLSERVIQQANQEIQSLRNQVAVNLRTSEESPKLQFELQQAQKKMAELEETLTSRTATLIDVNMRATKNEEYLKDANEKVKTFEADLAALQGQLELSKIEAWKRGQEVLKKDDRLQEVQKQLQALQQQQPQAQEIPQNSDEIVYLRQQVMQLQRAITQCDQNRAVAYAQLETQKNEIADLRRQLEGKQNETDAMFALRTQLDMYKTDFEAERDAKEDIRRDKNKLTEDLQHLHRRNQQLQEEIELHRNQLQQYGGVPRSRQEPNNSGQGGSGWSSSKKEPVYKCPKCQFGFHTLTAAENHVLRCIELDSLP